MAHSCGTLDCKLTREHNDNMLTNDEHIAKYANNETFQFFHCALNEELSTEDLSNIRKKFASLNYDDRLDVWTFVTRDCSDFTRIKRIHDALAPFVLEAFGDPTPKI